MSGICAVVQKESPERLSGLLGSLSAGLALVTSERIRQESVDGAGVGVAARFAGQQIYSDAELILVCDAELLNEEELAESAGPAMELPRDTRTAALLAALYKGSGAGFVARLRGAFSIILFDRRQRQLL